MLLIRINTDVVRTIFTNLGGGETRWSNTWTNRIRVNRSRRKVRFSIRYANGGQLLTSPAIVRENYIENCFRAGVSFLCGRRHLRVNSLSPNNKEKRLHSFQEQSSLLLTLTSSAIVPQFTLSFKYYVYFRQQRQQKQYIYI